MKTPPPASPHWDYEVRLLAWLAVCASVLSFLYYFRHGNVLLDGDAVAHINIARRVFDSKTPGLLQLGTVWLPLPHLLILPFVISNSLWQSGAGGSPPSMGAYVFGVIGIFRLVRALAREGAPDQESRVLAWSAALVYGANPNLLYMQSTAMGETIYLAFFLWAVAHFVEFVRAANAKERESSLMKCGLCLAAACLTRYDGWFLAAVLVAGAVIASSRPGGRREDGAPGSLIPASRTALVKFVLIAVAAPALWLAYNAAVYRNPLEFANGPYSAKAIEQNTGTVNPAKGNVWAASSYFLKAAELNMGEGTWPGRVWLGLALLGSLAARFTQRGRLALLLWAPLPFYALSIAFGAVPIFVPMWWPYSNYNLRYGLQLLPAIAVFAPLAVLLGATSAAGLISRQATSLRKSLCAGIASLVFIVLAAGGCYVMVWNKGPICYREATINSRGRIVLENQLARLLEKMPPQATLLMYLGEHVGALERAGFPLQRVINEGNHRVWKQPSDREGLWERALADPAAYADYIIAFEGDRVWQAAQRQHLTEVIEYHTTGQPRAIVYQGRTR